MSWKNKLGQFIGIFVGVTIGMTGVNVLISSFRGQPEAPPPANYQAAPASVFDQAVANIPSRSNLA
jgi:hypothetical protein